MNLAAALALLALPAGGVASAPPAAPSAILVSPAAAPPAAAPSSAAAIDAAPAAAASHPRVHAPGDPLEGFNRRMFRLFQSLDKAIFRPLALGYRQIVPRPIRSGVRHFFSNLGEPVVFLNDMLQLRPRRAIRTFGRFAINSTLGVGGLIDVATPEALPHHANGFGSTLGFYGVGPGPYVFVPFLGPSTLRDLVGGAGDAMVLPAAVGAPFDRTDYRIASAVITGLDQRAESDDDLQALYRTALDPYATLRSVYLQSRTAAIRGLKAHNRDGEAGPDELGDPLADPDPGADPAAAPAGAVPEPDPPADPAPPPPREEAAPPPPAQTSAIP